MGVLPATTTYIVLIGVLAPPVSGSADIIATSSMNLEEMSPLGSVNYYLEAILANLDLEF